MLKKLIAMASLLSLWPTASPDAQERYIQISASQVVLRFAPAVAAEATATASKGNICQLSAEKGDWFESYMFSGEARYIPRASASVVTDSITLSEPVSRRREIYLALGKAEDRAFADADRKCPPTNVDKTIEYQRVLDDRYKLEAMQKFGVQPVISNRLNAEGAKARWR